MPAKKHMMGITHWPFNPSFLGVRRIDKHALCHGGQTPGCTAWLARMTSRSAFLSGAKPRRFRVLRRKALTWLPWRNSQGPRPGQFRVLASGFRVSALSKRHKSGTATPPRGIHLQAPPRRRRMADGAADWQTAVFRAFKIQSDGIADNGLVLTR